MDTGTSATPGNSADQVMSGLETLAKQSGEIATQLSSLEHKLFVMDQPTEEGKDGLGYGDCFFGNVCRLMHLTQISMDRIAVSVNHINNGF